MQQTSPAERAASGRSELSLRRRRVALAFTEKKVVKEILEHLRLPATGPPIAPARIPAAGEDAPWRDDVPELQQSLP